MLNVREYLTRGWSEGKIAALKQLTPRIVEETEVEADERVEPAGKVAKNAAVPNPAISLNTEENKGICDKARG